MIGKRDRIKDLLESNEGGIEVHIKGWVRTKRDAKGFSFLEVNDGSCMGNIQSIVNEDIPDYEIMNSITTGCAVGIKGKLVESPGNPARGAKI